MGRDLESTIARLLSIGTYLSIGLIAVGVVFILWLKPKDVVTSPR